MTDVPQELMTPHEAARWFRRSPSWLRQQGELLKVGGGGAQPLYHVQVCRAYVMGKLCGLGGAELRRAQLAALAAACGLSADERIIAATLADPPAQAAARDGVADFMMTPS